MAISVLGIDFSTASVAVREQVALSGDNVAQLLRTVAAEAILPEAAIVSTCNRTEFYFASEDGTPPDLTHFLAHVAEVRGASAAPDPSIFYRLDGRDAVRHLFRVASSLESQIVGEREIQGQVKTAYRLACEARTAKFLFHRLMHCAFRAAKRVMTETDLGQGTASVAQAAVDLSGHVFASLAGKTVLLVGAGQTAESACQALVRAGATRLIVANRTLANAQQLADSFIQWRRQETQSGEVPGQEPIRCPALIQMLAECPMRRHAHESLPELSATAIALDDIASIIADADLVICSSGAAEPVLRAADLRPVLRTVDHSLLMIDISVPRNIDPALGDLSNVFLYNIDGLEALVSQNMERRRREIPRAETIIDDEVQRFDQWLSSLGVVPTIKGLTQHMAALQEAELDRYRKKFPEAERAKLEEFARTLCAKIMHDPIAFLRQLDGQEEVGREAAVSILRQMFKLDAAEENPEDLKDS